MKKFEQNLAIGVSSLVLGVGSFAMSNSIDDERASMKQKCILAEVPRATEEACEDAVPGGLGSLLLFSGGFSLALAGVAKIITAEKHIE